MFDNFFNVIIVIIAMVIFIGRTIAQTRRARSKTPPPKAPVPAFFEEDDDDKENYRDLAYYIKLEEQAAKAASSKKSIPKVKTEPLIKDTSIIEPVRTLVSPRPVPVASAKAPGPLNLSHLSPLKQAVVMAEVLGPPKGLQ